jgi:hypothetical protein
MQALAGVQSYPARVRSGARTCTGRVMSATTTHRGHKIATHRVEAVATPVFRGGGERACVEIGRACAAVTHKEACDEQQPHDNRAAAVPSTYINACEVVKLRYTHVDDLDSRR